MTARTRLAWERLRWRIVTVVNKIPGQCWTDLVFWALDGPRVRRQVDESPLPWRPQGWTCRADLGGYGGCYCGKVRSGPQDGAA